MDFCKYVNVFQGCSTVELPEPTGVAASWYFIKGFTGNTLPAATLPFGKYSCCAYTSGYPTGYGDHLPNSCPTNLRSMPEGARFRGLSHFHQSGTGAIDYYYNYAVTLPYLGAPNNEGDDILHENAVPGYYSVLSGGGILSETTVSEKSVYHRFTFPENGGRVMIDFTNDGLMKNYDRNQYDRPQCGKITLMPDGSVLAEITLERLKQFFYYRAEGAKSATLCKNSRAVTGDSVEFARTEDTYGVIFELDDKTMQGRLSVSLKSAEKARIDCLATEGSFDCVKQAAYARWNSYLGRIEIENDDEEAKEIFYSNLYHTIVKPSDRSGENPLWEENAFAVDFSTMWDIYKTQLPLIFTVYHEIGEKIISTFFDCVRHLGAFPHTLVLKGGFLEKTSQACMLAELSVCDAYYRGVKADYKSGIELMLKDIMRSEYANLSDAFPDRLTHLLDASDAARATACLARILGREDIELQLGKLAERFAECYNPKTGLLYENHDYYEGTFWNYSFRPHGDMAKRIELAGGKERFAQLLDRFFGFTYPDSTQTRFEGFNNESDIESPYAYHYIGRHDRISEITDSARRSMFTTGRGGIPGNNDSGGLSSCYVWNTVGVFPISGQDLMLIGSPYHRKTVFHLPTGDFTVSKQGSGIYVKRAVLNGRELADLSFAASEMASGGELIIETE